MTDLRKLLSEARAWIVANEKHESVCPTRVMGTWGRCRCGFVSIIGRIDGALAEKVEPVACDYGIPMLGGTYETQSGDRVKMVAINNIGNPYETLVDESGVNRYSRRLSDMGRCTGTAHDYSDPRNLKRPFKLLSLDAAPADQWRRVEDGLPEERIRVNAHDKLIVYDCFYGYASNNQYEQWDEKHWRETHNESVIKDIVAWMPLPALPEGE